MGLYQECQPAAQLSTASPTLALSFRLAPNLSRWLSSRSTPLLASFSKELAKRRLRRPLGPQSCLRAPRLPPLARSGLWTVKPGLIGSSGLSGPGPSRGQEGEADRVEGATCGLGIARAHVNPVSPHRCELSLPPLTYLSTRHQ